MASIQRLTSPRERRLQALPKISVRANSRRVLGLLLVLVSFLGGYITISRADQRVTAYVAARDLSPGQVVTAEDIRQARVSIDVNLYVTRPEQIVGEAVRSVIRVGEVLPRSQVGKVESARHIAIPIRSTSLPDLARGSRADLWSDGELIARDVPIVEVSREASYRVVTISAAPTAIAGIIAALEGEIVLVKVP